MLLHLLLGFKRLRAAGDRFAVVVEVGRGPATRSFTLLGHNEAEATAACAAHVACALADRRIGESGVWLPEQALEPEPFFADISRAGFVVCAADDNVRTA